MKDLKINDVFEIEEKNKKELAENLHDHLGQALAMIRLTLKKIQGNAIFSGMDGEIDYALNLTEKCIKYSRDLVSELSPIVLYKFGLIPAVESLVENLQNRHKIKISFDCLYKPELSEKIKTYLYRSINELMINVIKHAQAKKITIRFLIKDNHFTIIVEDDGIGLQDNVEFGFGLLSIQERIRHLNGSFSINSLKKGTRANMIIPLDWLKESNESN